MVSGRLTSLSSTTQNNTQNSPPPIYSYLARETAKLLFQAYHPKMKTFCSAPQKKKQKCYHTCAYCFQYATVQSIHMIVVAIRLSIFLNETVI